MQSTSMLIDGWQSHAHPAWRRVVWPALLIGVSLTLTLGFACATPFAALGAAAALTLGRRHAVELTVGVWPANQFAGYLVLGYPQTVNSFAWGAALGAAAIAGTLTASAVAMRLRTVGPLAQTAAALASAYALYEALLFAVAVTLLGGTASFALPIVGRILVINALTLGGLYAVHQIAAAITVSRRRAAVPARPQPTAL
jgi:hypothetical protein